MMRSSRPLVQVGPHPSFGQLKEDRSAPDTDLWSQGLGFVSLSLITGRLNDYKAFEGVNLPVAILPEERITI